MYITLKSPKKELGLFNLEIKDIIIAAIFAIIFIILFTIECYQIGLIEIGIGIFLLLPLNFSQKNRMYKVILLVTQYLLHPKNYYYYNERRNDTY